MNIELILATHQNLHPQTMVLSVSRTRSSISMRKGSAGRRKSTSQYTKILQEWLANNPIQCTPILPPSRTEQQIPEPMPTLSPAEQFLKQKQDTLNKAKKSAERYNFSSSSTSINEIAGSGLVPLPSPSQPIPKAPEFPPIRPPLRTIRPPNFNFEAPEPRSQLENQSHSLVEVLIPTTTLRIMPAQRSETREIEAWSERLRARRRRGNSLPDNQWNSCDMLLPSTERDEDEEEYAVERVAGEKIGDDDIHEYLIKWVGYEELDWIPAADCFCPDLIAEFQAAQRVARIAARKNGQKIEAARLDRLAEAAQARLKRAQQTKARYKRRNPKTGRFIRHNKYYVQDRFMNAADKTMEVEEESDEVSVVPINEETITPRDARANTARLPSARGSPIYWETPQSEKSGETVWIRPKVEEEAQPVPLGFSSRSISRLHDWVEGGIEHEEVENEEEGGESQRAEEVERQMAEEVDAVEAATAEAAKLLEEDLLWDPMLSVEGSRIIAKRSAERDRLAAEVERKKKEYDDAVEALKLEEKVLAPQHHMALRHKASPRQCYSHTLSANRRVFNCHNHEREHQSKIQSLSFKGEARGQPLLNVPTSPLYAQNSSSVSRSPSSETEKLIHLRHARKRAKSILHRKAPPKRVRSEFRTQMGQKQAEYLINQTRNASELSLEPNPTPEPIREHGQIGRWVAEVIPSIEK